MSTQIFEFYIGYILNNCNQEKKWLFGNIWRNRLQKLKEDTTLSNYIKMNEIILFAFIIIKVYTDHIYWTLLR